MPKRGSRGMSIIASSATNTTGHGIISGLIQVLVYGLLIVVVGAFTAWLLTNFRVRASHAISARLNRARTGAAKLGVHTGRGDLRGQLDVLKEQKLGFIGWLRYVRTRRCLLNPTPKRVLLSYSRRDYHQDIIQQFLIRCIYLFQPSRIISAPNLRILLLAGAIVVIQDEHVGGLMAIIIHLHETVPWHSAVEWIREWYVLVSLVVVALIVATRSPIVDRVRARDEAAKDANRLLAQLYGRLSDVQRCAAEYIKIIDEGRTEVVARAVLKASNGRYTWTHGYGLRLSSDLFIVNTPEDRCNKEADRLEQACKELSDHLVGYRRNGLHTVAQRLTWPVFSSLFECNIMFSDAELCAYLRTRLLLDFSGNENTYIRDQLEMITEAERRDEPGRHEFLRSHANDAIRDYACSLDMKLVSAYVTLLHLSRINSFLNRRLHGNTRTRLAGSFVR